jgi:anti-sigma factor RsiW
MSPNRPAEVEHPLEMISAYMDGRLEAADRASVHEHLGGCAACQAILADFRALAVAARRESAPPIPTYLLEKIGRRIDTESEARPVSRLRFLPRARLPLATAAAVLVVASLWVVWRGRIPGERLAESRSDATPQASGPSTAQASSPQPESASAPPASPNETVPRPVQPGVAKRSDASGDAGLTAPFAPSPPAPPPFMAGKSEIKKDASTLGGSVADRQENNKMSAARTREAIPAPKENLDQLETATGALQGATGAEGAPAAMAAGTAKRGGPAGTTLVFILPEARVSVLADLGVVLTAGDYICPLAPGGAEEVRALAELRSFAVARRRPSGAGPEDARLAGAEPSGGAPRELVVPAPPASGPLPAEAAAEAHRRVWILLRDSLLARAEARCGPAPPALHPEH